jgi:hypothetical protein
MNKPPHGDEDMTEQNNTWMHFVVTYNIAPYAVRTQLFSDCATAGQILQRLKEHYPSAGDQLIAKQPFDFPTKASELESSEDEPLFLVPFDWVFKYEGKHTVYITFYFSQQLFRFAFCAQDAAFVKSNSYKL